MHEEMFPLTMALATVFKEIGGMLEQAGVMPLERFSDRFSDMAVKAEENGDDQSRYLSVWAYMLLETVRNRPEKPVN